MLKYGTAKCCFFAIHFKALGLTSFIWVKTEYKSASNLMQKRFIQILKNTYEYFRLVTVKIPIIFIAFALLQVTTEFALNSC